MHITILMSSPRKNGNTYQCLVPFMDEKKAEHARAFAREIAKSE